jgi:hypothetical protein
VPRPAPSSYLVKELRTSGARQPVNSFGTRKAATWILPTGGTEIDQSAAKLQHDLVLKLRDTIGTSEYGTMLDFAKAHDLDYERIRDVLSGDRWATLDDLVTIATHLGLVLNVTVETDS